MNSIVKASITCMLAYVCVSCSAFRVMPIQLARVVQLESYEQTFDFGEATAGETLTEEQRIDSQLRLNARIDTSFRHMIGEDNWQIVKDKYGFGPLRDELINHKLKLKGILTAVLHVDPYDHDSFFFEGNGRFFLVREENGEILLSGDFLIFPEVRRIDSLNKGYLDVDVLLFISRIPGEITRFHDTKVRYRIIVDTSRSRSQIYALDYDAAHPVYLLQEGPSIITDPPIGHLTFDSRIGDSKLLDLRGRGYLRDDYATPPRNHSSVN